ncbi:DEAD/DEAH box helicase family protein [Caecibacteroides pullorum]|uniref:DEAD/DEAH box helicase family protein n=1 Tax=Caecibacteroides pullorum TaxID=2725562 RepID=A0AA40ZTB5_9BACT|nr:DEAD/DEAH box helicase family protein [Caecibacteroides pullorum]MBM6857617.1 DEAD/DEAH box helicase family protein [Caecibacteroides pullorum]MBV8058736.1 DEAD/DEAH box helicase family protein [Caecibacteroides pullorum]
MSNFDYLKDIEALSNLYRFCKVAEDTQKTDRNNSAINCRRGLEWIVKAIYKLKGIELKKTDTLYELMTGQPFTDFIENDRIMMAAHYIRKVGNKSAHTGNVKGGESFFALLNLYNVVGFILLRLGILKELAPFNRDLIPDKHELFVSTPTETEIPDKIIEDIAPEKVSNPVDVNMESSLSEAETRKYFIDIMLEEAGWEVLDKKGAIVSSKACIETEVQGMPNSQNKGYVDYVLFGNNGKPLAVIEAKRTTKDPKVGRQQAILYAGCLEKQYGVKPVIYYSNGYKTFIIDGLGYPDRELLGFHTESELELLIQRRGRGKITDLSVNENITDREYQKRGIKAICEHFNTFHRKGLLVMATGTGKTRVSISLSDVLMKNGWVKNILFLADRTALVNQAAKNYTKLLPSATVTVLSENKEPDMNARIMFSTYQTMINYIDTESKLFSIGRFDLIIIDEAHRSIFGKYTAIFDYFDSLLVGLTATPRDQVDKSTYDVFDLETGEPNFSYELKEAVNDGFLVDYTTISRTTQRLREGIKYNSLSNEEKKQLEEVWEYEKAKNDLNPDSDYHRDINSNEIFKYIFNIDTIDKVLQDLMNNGLKVQSGDVIGKTIIFAYNHKHAIQIVKRFNVLYPELGPDFCVLIDNTVNYSQTLINCFEERNKMPQIAVSVDMLDTGIDVPDILNLVFFKKVYSYIKFWQMIGRGTRLSKDIFDIGEDKKTFYIFDWCGNFEYFDENPRGNEALPQVTLSEKLFGLRVDIAFALQHVNYQSDEGAKKLHDEIKDILISQVGKLNTKHISVRQNIDVVDKFMKKENWIVLSATDVLDLKDKVAPLVIPEKDNETAKKFDAIMLYIQLSMLDSTINAGNYIRKVQNICISLQEKAAIPQVQVKMDLIKEISVPAFWNDITLNRLEYVRKEIRDLVQFIIDSESRDFILNIKDIIEEKSSVNIQPYRASYKQRVEEFLNQNAELPVLVKIRNIEQLNQKDISELERILWTDLGTEDEYINYLQNCKMSFNRNVAAFIRSQIGIDRKAAMAKLSQFFSDNNFTSLQEEYLKTIITYVSDHGDISFETLVNEPPFDEFEWSDVFGQDFIGVKKYVEDLHDAIIVA